MSSCVTRLSSYLPCFRHVWRFSGAQLKICKPASLTYSALAAASAGTAAASLTVFCTPWATATDSQSSKPEPKHGGVIASAVAKQSVQLSRLRIAWRAASLLCVIVPLLCTHPLSELHPRLRHLWLRCLGQALTVLGPAFTKWGALLALLCAPCLLCTALHCRSREPAPSSCNRTRVHQHICAQQAPMLMLACKPAAA